MVPANRPNQLRSRGSRTYSKPPLSVEELVERLSERGLHIPDRERAGRYIRHIGYYRLSPYSIPFREGPSSRFRASSSFDDILDLYMFDRDLRLLVTEALERVEVAVRAAITDHMATTHQDSHWYMDGKYFSSVEKHSRLIASLEETVQQQLRRRPERTGTSGLHHRSALEHYLTTYGSPTLPPSWLMVETLTLGQLHRLYEILENPDDKKAIAASLGLKASILESWLRTYVRVRNICAHHGRLWNVGLGVTPAIPRSRSIPWLRQPLTSARKRRLYVVLASFQTTLMTITPHSTWASRLAELVGRHPAMYRHGMGMPEDWESDPFWAITTTL